MLSAPLPVVRGGMRWHTYRHYAEQGKTYRDEGALPGSDGGPARHVLGERLRLVHLLLSVGAILQYGGQGCVLMLVLVVNLLCAWTRFMRCGLYHRLERLCDLETDSINTKNDCSMETKTMDAEMMNGLFSGANFSGEVQIVVAPRGRVVFKEEAVSGERGTVSDEGGAVSGERMSGERMSGEELDDRQILFITHEEQRLWAERFVAFLREHKMMDENGLTKDRDSYINRALACFMDQWQTMGLLREKYLGKAPSLFLYHSCGIRGIDPKTHGNACGAIIRECLLMERNSPLQCEVASAVRGLNG